jgi:hypothetical protein
MSGHWRFSVAAFLLCAGFPAAPASAQEQCALQPGKSTAPGQHWVYRLEGRRKCWHQADQATISAKKQIRQHRAKRLALAPENNDVAPPKKTVMDARAQLLSAAPDSVQSTAPAPEVVDTASAAPDDTAVTAAPIATHPTVDQLRPEQVRRPSADAEMLLAAEPPANDAVDAAVPLATSGAPSIADADEGHHELVPTRAGVVLIALGFILLLGSLLVNRFLGLRMASIPPA